MKKILSVLLTILFAFATAVAIQNTNSSTTMANSNKAKTKRKPIFRANKDQIKSAQNILKQRGFYAGEQTGKLDAATRTGIKKYQEAEQIKITGTLNKMTLEKMGIALTDTQRAM